MKISVGEKLVQLGRGGGTEGVDAARKREVKAKS